MSDRDGVPEARLGRRGVLVAGTGAALGALALTADEASAAVAKSGWRFCPKCRGLFLSPKNEAGGSCPAGGKHKPRKDISYVLYALQGTIGGTWVPWFKCDKCAALFLNASGSTSDGVCPRGGEHNGAGTRFVLWIGGTVPGVMDDAWDMCTKCHGLYNFAGGSVGACPVDANGHTRSGSLVVKLVMIY